MIPAWLLFLSCLPLFMAMPSSFTFHSLNDIHLNPLYQPDLLPDTYCSKPLDAFSSLSFHPVSSSSLLGRPGCDPPYALLRFMVQKLKKSNRNPEFLLLPGDFVAHGFSQDPNGNYSETKYEFLEEIIKRASFELSMEFHNTFLFPAIGNNDVEFHYQVPKKENKAKYYEMMFENWFEHHPKNMRLRNIEEVKADFLNGGYYKADISENFSVIVLNTLYFSVSNNRSNDPETGEKQLKWLECQLEKVKNQLRKAIVVYHIFPGLNYYNGIQYFLNKTANEIIQGLFYKFKEVIILNVASHIHLNGFRIGHLERKNDSNTDVPRDIFGPTIISGSLSPIFYNNPSFLTLEIEDNQPKRALYTYFKLNEFLNQSDINFLSFKESENFFFDYDLTEEYGLADIGEKSLETFASKLNSDEEMLKKFLVLTYGYPDTIENRNYVLSFYLTQGLFTDNVEWTFDPSEKRRYLCSLTEMGGDGFKQCLGSENL